MSYAVNAITEIFEKEPKMDEENEERHELGQAETPQTSTEWYVFHRKTLRGMPHTFDRLGFHIIIYEKNVFYSIGV